MSTGRNSPVDLLQVINKTEQMEIDRISVSELIFPQSRHKAKPSWLDRQSDTFFPLQSVFV